MKLKNNDLKGLATFLVDEELSGKSSRLRTRFVRLLEEEWNQINDFIDELLVKHAQKDKQNNPIKKDNQLQIEDLESLNREYNELMNEEFVIDEVESKREMLLEVRNILENTKKEFSGKSAFEYDRWCEAFENLKI
ncbi:hypothetical protein [Halalkalibacter krulwichiae]|uniref:Uncharacterized protein n=1 Tax=Halalkalibacter krulwichiae TaxID=199441 RepID=A0A1X9MHL0_9BACI|nr:hypothetical protein [Halalkalibacter krulwichiae]ARK32114.1 hypothetical protein BkAM31D_20970 [Halalkalibacter krulwichiae]